MSKPFKTHLLVDPGDIVFSRIVNRVRTRRMCGRLAEFFETVGPKHLQTGNVQTLIARRLYKR